MIKLSEYKILEKNITTIAEISKDTTNGLSMIDSPVNAISFDRVKTEYTNSLGLSEETAASFDALALTSDDICFIEFKNGRMKNEKQNVKNKIRDSLLIFCDITAMNINKTREFLDFILVYNEEKNPLPNQITKQLEQDTTSRDNIGKYFMKKAKQEFILFDLEKFKKLYFKEVHTYTEKEFTKLYLSKYV